MSSNYLLCAPQQALKIRVSIWFAAKSNYSHVQCNSSEMYNYRTDRHKHCLKSVNDIIVNDNKGRGIHHIADSKKLPNGFTTIAVCCCVYSLIKFNVCALTWRRC